MDPPLVSQSLPHLNPSHLLPYMQRSLSKPDIKGIWGNSLSVYRSIFCLLPTPSPSSSPQSFLSKDNFSEYFMGYIASVSPCRAGRVARNDDWQAHTLASARRQPFFFGLLSWHSHSFFFLPSLVSFCHRQQSSQKAESLAADHLAVSLNSRMTTELLPIHLILLVKMPTYG